MAKIPVEERQLNPEQKAAVRFSEGPLLIIAGAGTGKTTVVTERIKYLITSGKAKPQEILALTFTEKASREMETRVDIALPYGVTQMWISTFHAFCDRVLRGEAINIGIDPGYKLMTEAETILFFRKNIFTFDLKYFRPLGNPSKFISGMIQHFSRLKDEDVTPQEYFKFKPTEDKEKYLELANAFRTYEELKVKEGVADYADLISWTLRLFRTRPAILKRYQQQFKYILIDEFQDTNFAQNELAILLAGKKKNITVVGDDDQAIYRWRGAAISNIIQFRKTFPKAKIVVLTKNYRSTKEILDRSHDLIEHNNPDRLEVAEKIDKKLESMRRKNGIPIEVLYAERVEHEADLVAKRIKKILSENSDYSYADFAILVRANNHAEPFVRALARAGIPYQFLGPGQLFRQQEVKDLIAYLKVLYNFEDNVAMYRVLTMDWVGVSARDVAVLLNFSRKYGMSLFEACEKSDLEQVKKLITMIHRHLGLIKKETAGQILYYFLADTGLLKQLTLYKSTKEEKIAENIAKFFNKLKTYETEHEDAGVFTVVDWIDLSMTLGESPLAADMDWSENNAVNILTVHSAKGLEVNVVFLVNLVNARFPTTERKEQIPIPDALVKEILPIGDYHEEEERRLFYVGMTRARDFLFFTGAKFYGEGKREKKLSPFIAEAVGNVVRVPIGEQNVQLSFLDWKPADAEAMAGKKPIRQPISYLSYSQLDTFMTCPLQYRYRYILRIPVPPSAALSFGDTMHKTIRAFYELVRAGAHPAKQDLLRLLDDHWSRIGYGDKKYEEKMKRHGRELLEGFYVKGYDPKVVPTGLEEPFKLKITPTLTLGGKIDRIDTRRDGTMEIIDYKTGTAPKARDPKKDLQLTVYAMAGGSDKVIVSFYFFEDQTKVSATRTKEQLKAAKEEIARKADEISRSDFRATPGKYCDFCEFRLICEAWT
ncbi:MAG: UvrD-helicase domain-containing protein [Candidatus Gottesmanbacteria bacterium]|nr:UvrD-helicase domain-containing protein [Candidatus Gottesmanbacteria bacterium]